MELTRIDVVSGKEKEREGERREMYPIIVLIQERGKQDIIGNAHSLSTSLQN